MRLLIDYVLEIVWINWKYEDGIPIAIKPNGSSLSTLAMGKTQDAHNVKEIRQHD